MPDPTDWRSLIEEAIAALDDEAAALQSRHLSAGAAFALSIKDKLEAALRYRGWRLLSEEQPEDGQECVIKSSVSAKSLAHWSKVHGSFIGPYGYLPPGLRNPEWWFPLPPQPKQPPAPA